MNEASWGMRFNQFPDYHKIRNIKEIPDRPDWLDTNQIRSWQEKGLIIWNNENRKIESLNGQHCLRLLEQLESQDNWKSEGVSVTRLVTEFEIQLPPRGRRKKVEKESEQSSKSRTYYKEVLHLPSEAGPEIISLINTHKSVISDMANQEKRQFDDAMKRLWESVLDFAHKEQLKKINFDGRTFKWILTGESQLACTYLSTGATICLEENRFFWCACVKRSGFSTKFEYFQELLAAVEWTEKTMVEVEDEPQIIDSASQFPTEQQRLENIDKLRIKLSDGPYWIDPLKMEPKTISYKIIIQVETAPIDFKTYKSQCGEVRRYDERYPSPTKLATAINLDRDQFDFFQPLGENSDWHQITSLTSFYHLSAAQEKSQQTWDQSRIIQQFKDGKIRRARYGIEEVETSFETYFGACEHPDHPWEAPETRNEHMLHLALRQSISFSLEVQDFRDFLGVSNRTFTDEKVLHMMHKTRADSKYVPDEIKLESKIWLAQHDIV